jgi:hypothetical protein
MRRVHGLAVASTALLLVTAFAPARAQDQSKAVAGGGISAPGWQGQIDANEARRGRTLNNSKLVKEGDVLHVTTGPAVSYWNPANKASGDYTVKAKFTEPNFMGLNSHPHPYGVFIGGNDLGTDQATLLYCEAYGNGMFVVRGFGPGGASFKMNGEEGEPSPAVNKASAKGQPVSQEIAMSVKGDKVDCAINGKVVATYNKSDVVGAGKLKSTDGTFGIRFAHNTEGTVTGLTMTKP